MSDPYRPIPCDLHDHYEIAAIQHRRHALRWRDASGRLQVGVLRFLDVQTRADGEFLLARASHGQVIEIRLDRVLTRPPFEAMDA